MIAQVIRNVLRVLTLIWRRFHLTPDPIFTPEMQRSLRWREHPVRVGEILSAGEFDGARHIVVAIGKPHREWDDDLQYHRRLYPYSARAATREEIENAPPSKP